MRGWAALAALALSGCLGHAVSPGADGPLRFSLPELGTGRAHASTDDLGHVVLLDVFATWCRPCQEALPRYQALAAAYASRGVRFYVIAVDEDPSKVGPYLQRLGVRFPVLLDPGSRVAEGTLHVRMMPTAFLLDATGRVRQVHEGDPGDAVPSYHSELDALLRG